MLQKIARRIKHTYAKIKISQGEREFHYGEHTLKYYYAPCKGAEMMVVVFSGFPAIGKPAAYNMVASFNDLKINRLYILDDFGFQNRGAYYMSEQGDFYVRDMVLELLKLFPSKKRIFLGSSKGGTAAIYFGIQAGADQIIAGAPQFYLGDYLVSEQSHIPILDAMAGDHTPASIKKYNQVMPEMIESATNSDRVRILLHYSKKEHTFQPHIAPMIALLEKCGFEIEHDEEEYLNHGDVAKYFPALCRRELKAMLTDEKR